MLFTTCHPLKYTHVCFVYKISTSAETVDFTFRIQFPFLGKKKQTLLPCWLS